MSSSALKFKVIAECPVTKARVSEMVLPHGPVNTPVFMPVGTQGTVKGLLTEQLEALECQIILGNTYHLGTRPGSKLIKQAGGLHKFMGWNKPILTDSGGFQMVSLLELAEITEEGVKFKSPYGDSECMLTPEHSIEIQNDLGADIMMQLDDVVSSTITGERVKEAMHRTTRWLDRCLKAHSRPDDQNIFPIVQGGLDSTLRKKSAELHCEREVNGFAVGGLSGGESKHDFWKMVTISTDILPSGKPRYLMGVGYAEDMLVCCALGIDMFDCVYPTRTARFGNAITFAGKLNLGLKMHEFDFRPVEEGCECLCCKNHTRSYLNSIIKEAAACSIISIHNIFFQMKFMRLIRENIINKTFPDFVRYFMKLNYPKKDYPQWAVDALSSVSINLEDDEPISDKVILP
ncbi:UNVERIFIED_CONTAM: hypothetical protein PYX00_006529 [Menopon gallinae]|uniref:Queuine tRNA-ribosyltransferase catalytic subunit 1 n=1 Tax=Menopon gallinae TaxID=328185 RepID=A0AAW2HWJ7_9NEOP